MKYVELSRIKAILQLQVTFVESLFTLEPFIGDFYNFIFVTKWGPYSYFKLLIMHEYWLCSLICAESDKENFVDGRYLICITVLIVGNNISILNHKMIFDQ